MKRKTHIAEKKSLVEARRKDAKMLDFRRIGVSWERLLAGVL